MPDTFPATELSQVRVNYHDNFALAVQQTDSRLMSSFSFVPDVQGEQAQLVELVGKVQPQRNAPSTAPTPNNKPGLISIWFVPQRISDGFVVTDEAKLRLLKDPTNRYTLAHAAGFNRERDAIMNEAMFGPRLVKNTDTPLALPTPVAWGGTVVPVDNDTPGTPHGLSVKKILAGLEALGIAENDLDRETVTIAQTMKENTALFNSLQVTSKDYRDKAVFEDKFVRSFMGINFHIYNTPALTAGTGYRRIPMYLKSGMHYGKPMPLKTDVAKDPGLQFNYRTFMAEWFCASRSEDEKVVEILCAG